MVAVDKQWYLDVNGFARHTAWAHRFLTDLYDRALSPVGAGLLALAALVLLAWWSARRQRERMVAVIWSGLGALISFGLAQILLKALAKPRPYEVLHNVEVLVPRLGHSSYALPDSHSVVAGAVLCGLLLARRWRIGALALLVSLLLWFSGVYVGADYPSDVVAGAGFGVVVSLVLWPLGSWLLNPVVESAATGPLGWLLASRGTSRRLGRPLVVQGQTSKLPTAKAMDALRLASEAARRAPAVPTPPSSPGPSAVRTTAVRTSTRGQGSPAGGEAS